MLLYYHDEGNNSYAFLLLQRITHATELLITNPYLGFIEPSLLQLNKEYRSLIEGHYKIIYSAEYDCIRIYQIFDTRQSPDKLMDLFR
uniref:type II toxin-antitoxin system RelE/ParE family toxin n=1 Tax=Parabacteroides distasonis TaxID=823 RepID=UPI0040270BB3